MEFFEKKEEPDLQQERERERESIYLKDGHHIPTYHNIIEVCGNDTDDSSRFITHTNDVCK